MSLWVKLCGISTPSALEAAVAAGADAIGLVMTKSSRRITVEQASDLADEARGSITTVAVFFEPGAQLVERVRDEVGVDLFQAEPDYLEGVDGIERLCVVHDQDDLSEAVEEARSKSAGRVLVESSGHGGFGSQPDWNRVRGLGDLSDVVVAGGLRPDNVGRVVNLVSPGGVDVSSGVETSPGVKDPVLMMDFVDAARSARQKASS
jgi:phosphoribosylanthranilate isomerase